MCEPKFVTGECALVAGDRLVVSDLHIGIEYEFRKAGINVTTQTEDMQKRIAAHIKETNSKKLMVLGDVKHKVPGTTFQEERDVPAFFRGIKNINIEIVLGNHDAGIKNMLPDNVKVYDSKGILRGRFYYTHGHTWPDRSFVEADYVIMGHSQPQIEFRDSIGYRWVEKVWVIADLKKEIVKKHFGDFENLPKLIIMPAFNRFAGGFPLNRKSGHERKREFSSPITKMSLINKAKIYLLDGTYLGRLGDIKTGH